MYKLYKEQGKDFVPKLKNLLAAGSSKSPRDLAAEIGFDITKEDLFDLYESQGGTCAITGLSFCFEMPPKKWKNHPYSLSLNRIDSSGGYTVGNLRFVLTAVNLAFSEWGEDIFKEIVDAYVQRKI